MTQIRATYINHSGSDKLVADVARVSFANKTFDPSDDPTDKDINLIKYLARGLRTKEFDALLTQIQDASSREEAHALYETIRHTSTHFTPFTHNSITVQCTAPFPIRTQAFKHKLGFVENEESRRYISGTPELYLPDHLRSKAEDVKQGSGTEHDQNEMWLNHYRNYCGDMINLYEDMIADGVCPEQARFVLPQGCMTNWIWTGNVFSFANMFNKRIDPHAQKEVQDLALAIQEVVEPLFPISWAALTRQDLGA